MFGKELVTVKFSDSLKKNKDFKYVYEHGVSRANKYLVMYVIKNQLNSNRVGISVSKKVGNSVVRHHLARLIRESYRLNEETFIQGVDIVIVVRVNAKNAGFHEIQSALLHLAKISRIRVEDQIEEDNKKTE